MRGCDGERAGSVVILCPMEGLRSVILTVKGPVVASWGNVVTQLMLATVQVVLTTGK